MDMLRKTVITLLAVASVGLAAPTMALARAGGGGGGGGGGHGGGGSFGGGHGGVGGGGFHGGGFAGSFQVAASKAAASVLGWPTVSEMEDSTIVTVAVSTIAPLGAVLETASSHTITMTATLMIIRMGMATIIAAVAMWF